MANVVALSLPPEPPEFTDEWGITIRSSASAYHKQMAPWAQVARVGVSMSRAAAEWYAESRINGLMLYRETVESNPRLRGGLPVLKGTGFTVADTLAELSVSSGPDEVAERFDLNAQTVRDLLDALSLLYERPM